MNNNKKLSKTSEPEGSSTDTAPTYQSEEESSFLAGLNCLTNKGPFLSDEGKIAPRMFRIEERVVFAFLLEEIDDSFLVAFPAILKELPSIGGVKSVIASQLVPTALCRFLKSNVSLVAFPTGEHLLTYLSGSVGWFKDLPGYFTTTRITQIESLTSILKNQLDVDSEVVTDVEEPAFVTPDKLLLPQAFWPKQRH